MQKLKHPVAIFLALLLTILQIGYGIPLASDDSANQRPTKDSPVVLTSQTSNTCTFNDQRQTFQTLLERIHKGLLKITAPDWFRNDLSAFFDKTESGADYLAVIILLPYRSETPLITFPFHYFW